MDTGLYTIYQTSDVDNFYENDGTVLDMYSENQTEPILIIIQQGLQRCGNYSAEGIATTENISFHNPLLVCGSHGFRCSFHHPNGR
jgi:hypothetical protein